MEYGTTTYENIKRRAQYLTQQGGLSEDAGNAWNKAAEFAMALCEEIDRLRMRVDELEKQK